MQPTFLYISNLAGFDFTHWGNINILHQQHGHNQVQKRKKQERYPDSQTALNTLQRPVNALEHKHRSKQVSHALRLSKRTPATIASVTIKTRSIAYTTSVVEFSNAGSWFYNSGPRIRLSQASPRNPPPMNNTPAIQPSGVLSEK